MYGDSGGAGIFNGSTIAGSEGMYLNATTGVTAFYTNGSERMRIDNSGRLLVGSTVTDPISSNTDGVSIGDSGDGRIKQFHNGARHTLLVGTGTSGVGSYGVGFYYHNGTSANLKGSIVINTGSVTYNTSSDARLKDITGEARGLEVINALNPVAYNWKADGQSDEGLIAQEVEEIVPNAVSQNEEEYYQMDYSKLVVHLVKGMKEQQEQIESLKSEIELLKGGQ